MRINSKSTRPTQRNIADKVGVSVAAVSRALSGDPLIAPETRDRVKKTADAMGYVPDRAATRLRTGRTNVISLVLPPHEELLGFGTSFVRGISDVLGRSEYHLVVMPTFDTEAADAAVKRIVENGLADGVLLSRTEPNDVRIRFLIENDFPFVCHGRTELATAHPFVDFDNREFAYRSVLELAAKGVGKLLVLMPPSQLTFRHHIMQGLQQGVLETGLTYEEMLDVDLDSDPKAITSAIKKRFSQSNPPTGLILPGDLSALAALAALEDMGLGQRNDIHLMIKQTSGAFDHLRPRVPTVFEDIASAGKLMAKMLLARIGGTSAIDLQFIQELENVRTK